MAALLRFEYASNGGTLFNVKEGLDFDQVHEQSWSRNGSYPRLQKNQSLKTYFFEKF